MVDHLFDTRPEIAELQRKLLRQATPARKLAMVAEMYETFKILALSGLRSRYPDESPEKLRRRLADILVGQELARKAYGPLEESK
jgi:hypothetical protein